MSVEALLRSKGKSRGSVPSNRTLKSADYKFRYEKCAFDLKLVDSNRFKLTLQMKCKFLLLEIDSESTRGNNSSNCVIRFNFCKGLD